MTSNAGMICGDKKEQSYPKSVDLGYVLLTINKYRLNAYALSVLMACFELLCYLIDTGCCEPADNTDGDGVKVI